MERSPDGFARRGFNPYGVFVWGVLETGSHPAPSWPSTAMSSSKTLTTTFAEVTTP